MKKLDKYIQKSNFVKVYIGDKDGNIIKHFEGFIFSYSDEFVFMSDLSDFNYDGFVVLRKEDIVDVRFTESEKYFEHILRQENTLRHIRLQKREYPFRLGSMEKMFKQLMDLKVPVIVENLYDEDEEFLIGPIREVGKKVVLLKYFNTVGEFDQELLEIDFDKITFFSFDSPYANLFYKYAEGGKSIDMTQDDEEIEEVEELKTKVSKIKKEKPSKKKEKKSKEKKDEKSSKKKSKKEKEDKPKKKKKKSATSPKKKDKKKSKKRKAKDKKSKKDKKYSVIKMKVSKKDKKSKKSKGKSSSKKEKKSKKK